VSVSPSQKVVWRPLVAIWCRLGVCSHPLGATAGKADAIPCRGRREIGGIPMTATATRGTGGGGSAARSGGGRRLWGEASGADVREKWCGSEREAP
jgi:hypothetical protein